MTRGERHKIYRERRFISEKVKMSSKRAKKLSDAEASDSFFLGREWTWADVVNGRKSAKNARKWGELSKKWGKMKKK